MFQSIKSFLGSLSLTAIENAFNPQGRDRFILEGLRSGDQEEITHRLNTLDKYSIEPTKFLKRLCSLVCDNSGLANEMTESSFELAAKLIGKTGEAGARRLMAKLVKSTDTKVTERAYNAFLSIVKADASDNSYQVSEGFYTVALAMAHKKLTAGLKVNSKAGEQTGQQDIVQEHKLRHLNFISNICRDMLVD